MELMKLKISSELTKKLRTLKIRTGLTPNILCRIGLCLSFNEQGLPDISNKQPEDGMEFNRYTLTGEYDILFFILLKQKCLEEGVKPEDNLNEIFISHIYRGVRLLYNRCKSLSDLKKLLDS